MPQAMDRGSARDVERFAPTRLPTQPFQRFDFETTIARPNARCWSICDAPPLRVLPCEQAAGPPCYQALELPCAQAAGPPCKQARDLPCEQAAGALRAAAATGPRHGGSLPQVLDIRVQPPLG